MGGGQVWRRAWGRAGWEEGRLGGGLVGKPAASQGTARLQDRCRARLVEADELGRAAEDVRAHEVLVRVQVEREHRALVAVRDGVPGEG